MAGEKICPVTGEMCLVGCKGDSCFIDTSTDTLAFDVKRGKFKSERKLVKEVHRYTGYDTLVKGEFLTSSEQKKFRKAFIIELEKKSTA